MLSLPPSADEKKASFDFYSLKDVDALAIVRRILPVRVDEKGVALSLTGRPVVEEKEKDYAVVGESRYSQWLTSMQLKPKEQHKEQQKVRSRSSRCRS